MSPPLNSELVSHSFNQYSVMGVTPCDVWGEVTKGYITSFCCLRLLFRHTLPEPSYQDVQNWAMTRQE